MALGIKSKTIGRWLLCWLAGVTVAVQAQIPMPEIGDIVVPNELMPWQITGDENGERLVSQVLVWNDTLGTAELADAERALQRYRFRALQNDRSTGLLEGKLWVYMRFYNPSDIPQTLHLEYIDHQLVNMTTYQRRLALDEQNVEPFQLGFDLAMDEDFDTRPIAYHRLAIPVTVAGGETAEVLMRLGYPEKGFYFPSMRVWEPDNLRQTQSAEILLVGFLAGGLVLMALVSLTVGVATAERVFYSYSLYALAKVALWWTVAGFTHQFVVRDHYHWSYMSVASAFAVLTGVWFARKFLQSRRYTPKVDFFLRIILVLAVVLVLSAILQLQAIAVVVITAILLMYPLVCFAALLRWYQGVKEAGVFAIAWTFLVAGLVAQALRDLGYVEHNFINYYWPVVGSFTEMAVILIAMAMSLNRLRIEKDLAEQRYMVQLQNTTVELEAQVKKRTHELEEAKISAEKEALTDPLTGVDNRRSFFRKANKVMQRSRNRNAPFSVLVFDVDHFKNINDVYGHQTGDHALRQFAKTMQLAIRDFDIFARLGGEEFALLIAGDNSLAINTAERLRKKIEELSIATEVDEFRMTTSVGIAHFNGEDAVEDLVSRADEALYEAKASGRNCVKIAV